MKSLYAKWIIILTSLVTLASARSQSKVLCLIDPFTSYLSGRCKEWCNENNVRVIEAVSEYATVTLGAEGRFVPEELRAPSPGEEIGWCQDRRVVPDVYRNSGEEAEEDHDDVPIPHIDDVFVIAESEAGVSVAQRIQVRIGAPGNGNSSQLCNKYIQNELCHQAGLPVNKQTLARSWEEAESWLSETLWKSEGARPPPATSIKGRKSKRGSTHMCVMKPNRGVATDGVYLCSSKEEAKRAFHKILSLPTYGEVNVKNDAVLVQEFTPGIEEYAVDTVTCNGLTRVAALWKYEKIRVNGSPFIYQCSELVDVESADERDSAVRRKVVNYAVRVLQAQGFKYGPCHIEIKVHPRTEEPRLMEINARWHAQPFLPIVQKLLGIDALTLTMESLFEPNKFLRETREAQKCDFGGNVVNTGGASASASAGGGSKKKLNHAPPSKRGGGRIVHLVQKKGGIVRATRYLEQLASLRSVVDLSHDAVVGEYLPATIDHRTHSGYVVLAHESEEQVQKDYTTILELQSHLVELVPPSGVSSHPRVTKRPEDRADKRSARHQTTNPPRNEIQETRFALSRATGKVRRIVIRALGLSGLAYSSILAGVLLLPKK